MNQWDIVIIISPYYQQITNGLLNGAKTYLKNHLREEYRLQQYEVSGALEIPLAAQLIAQNKKVDAIVALGAVIRGETMHFDHVCTQSASGLMQVSLKYDIPIGNGILTVENEAQAIQRSSDTDNNKGREAVIAAIGLCRLKRGFLNND